MSRLVGLRRGEAVLTVLICLAAGAVRAQPPNPSPRSTNVRYYNTSWDFNNVDVATLTRRLARVGLELPVRVEGRISGSLSVGVPWNAIASGRAWRLGGALASRELAVSGFVVRDVAIRLQYRDGVLRLEQLQVRVPKPGIAAREADGVLSGVAAIQLIPRGRFTATPRLTAFPLESLGTAFEPLRGVAGRVSGSLDAHVAVNRLRDLTAWTADGPLALEGFTFRDSPPADARVQFDLRRGVLSARDFVLNVGATRLTSQASLNLQGRRPWRLSAVVEAGQLGELLRLVDRFIEGDRLVAVADAIAGVMSGTVELAGTLAPLAHTRLSGHAALGNVAWRPPAGLRLPLRPLAAQQVEFDYRLAGQTVELTRMSAVIARGSIGGAAAVPLRNGNLAANIQWSGLRLSELLAEPFQGPGVSSGALALAIPFGAWSDPARWDVRLNARATEFTYDRWTVAEVHSGAVTLSAGHLRIPAASARLEGERIAASLDMRLNAPRAFTASVDAPRVRLETLRSIPQLAQTAAGLEGLVGVSANLHGVWQPWQATAAGRLVGSGIRYAGRTIDDLRLNLSADGEKVTLSQVQASLYGGTASGNGTVALAQQPGIDAQLNWAGVDAGRLLAGVPPTPVAVSGRTSGSLELTIPAGGLDRVELWMADAQVRLEALDVYAWRIRPLEPVNLRLDDGQLHAANLHALADGSPLRASLALGMGGAWTLDVRGSVDRARLERITALPGLAYFQGRVAGLANVEAHVQGTLDPVRISATGSADAREIRFDAHEVERIALKFALSPESLSLSAIEASVYGGRLTGAAVAPLTPTGAASAEAAWSDVDVGRFIDGLANLPTTPVGKTSGKVRLRIPPGAFGELTRWDFELDASLPEVRANGVPLASLAIRATQRDERLQYQSSGRLLGGVLQLSGARPAGVRASGIALLGDARGALRGANLEQLAQAAATPPAQPAPVDGTLNLQFHSSQAPDGWQWTTAVQVTDLDVAGRDLAAGVDVRLRGDQRSAHLASLTGQVAGGSLAGSGEWEFAPRSAGAVRINLRGARIEHFAELAFGADDAALAGPVDLQLQVRPGASWRLAGVVATARAESGDVALRNVRVPIDAVWHPTSGRLEARLSGVYLSLAGGRVTGRLTASRSIGWSLDGNFRFYRVDVAALTGSSYGRGRLTGTLDLAGRRVRSVNDLRGTLVATLEDTQARNVPVLTQVIGVVPGISSSATTFSDGRLEARLSRGVVRVEELSLASPQVQLFVTGRATLAGRLDLDAVVSTRDRIDSLLARNLLARLAVNAVAPVALLVQANEFLANRVIHLAIGGTLSRPTVRVLPFQTLREEAVRFFLRRATGAVVPRATASSYY